MSTHGYTWATRVKRLSCLFYTCKNGFRFCFTRVVASGFWFYTWLHMATHHQHFLSSPVACREWWGSRSRRSKSKSKKNQSWVTCGSSHIWQQWLQISQPLNFPVHMCSSTKLHFPSGGNVVSRYSYHHPKRNRASKKSKNNRFRFDFLVVLPKTKIQTRKKKYVFGW